MGEIVQARRIVAPSRTMSAANSSLAATLSQWRASEPLPDGTTAEACSEIVAYCEAKLAPCGREAAAVMLDRLFAIWPPASETAAAVWIDAVSEQPAKPLAEAIERMLRAQRQYPPKPGDLLAEVAQDDRLRRLYGAKLKAETAARFIRTKARAAALTRSVKESEDADLQRLRDRVSSRQEGVHGGLRRIEPEMTEAEAQEQRDRDVARFLRELEG
jgi:hypothetical protein